MRKLLIGILGMIAAAAPATAAEKNAVWQTEMATPLGITLQYLTQPKTRAGFYVQGIAARGRTVGFGSASGKSLYTYDGDTVVGKSSCVGECAAQWPAALVPAGAKPSTLWSIVTRDDGSKQWAFRGKPLYACAKDPEIGQAQCNGSDGKWHTATFEPGEGMIMPPGIDIDNVPSAGGETLTNATGMTLYVQRDQPKGKKAECLNGSCGNTWVPVKAAALASPIGEFTVVRGLDGTRQWAFRGKPLFTYSRDIETGDSDGRYVDGWVPAVVFAAFMPGKAHVIRPIGHSDVIANDKGMTLYKRDVSYQIVTGHGLARSVPTIPAMGRAVGTSGCDELCLKTWRPFLAAKDAQPSGFWQIADLPNGARQWVYQGYPIYTYTKDNKPGDVTGDQIYDVMVNDGVRDAITAAAPTTNGWALYWSYLEPT